MGLHVQGTRFSSLADPLRVDFDHMLHQYYKVDNYSLEGTIRCSGLFKMSHLGLLLIRAYEDFTATITINRFIWNRRFEFLKIVYNLFICNKKQLRLICE